MPPSASQEITLTEAEKRLGIESVAPSSQVSIIERIQASNTERHTASHPEDLPASLLNRKPKALTVSKTFRLPLDLANELERVAAIHDIPMVTILAEALELHLARFPKSA